MLHLSLPGGPTLGGWLVEIVYLVVSVSGWRVARQLDQKTAGVVRERRVWQAIAALFFFLCIARFLGLEAALTDAGRAVARAGGWYGQRQGPQLVVIFLLSILFIIAGIYLLTWSRKWSLGPAVGAALLGTTFVLAYLMVREISFHDVNRIISKRVFGVQLNWIMQSIGIGVVLMASEWRNRQIANAAIKGRAIN